MIKISYRQIAASLHLLLFAALLLQSPTLFAQGSNTSQQLVFAGLRSIAQQGQIIGVQTDSSGDVYLLLNQGDGVRLLKTDNSGSSVLAQSLLGSSGDVGTAIALDPAGDVYVTGTTTSALLTGTSGAAIPSRTDASTNSFVAKFDAGLDPLFVTFTGGSRIAATALAATSDAVFVTGITYAANLPVTSDGIQQSPAYGSSQNGFVERFSSDGATLVYATYLTGANGDTTPAAITADATDALYIAGETSATGFPTTAALVPAMLSNPSGFLTKLTPAGDGITYSTFVPGAGLTSIALDSTGQTLLLTGSVALSQFPVDTVAMPLVPTNYQVLLRIPLDGSTVESSTLIAPATQSFVAAGANSSAWVDGVLAAPMLPLTPLATLGSSFAVHVPAGTAIDQTARFGGLPNLSPTYASLPVTLTSIAVDPTGEPFLAGIIQPTASSNLLATETFDLSLLNSPTAAFPSTIAQSEVTAASCSGSLCAGSAGYLAKLSTSASVASLAFSTDDLPFIVLRNLGSGQASALQLSATGSTQTANCPATLYPGGECDILLQGGLAGTLTATAGNATAQSISFPTFAATAPASSIVYFPKEIDFGIQTSTSTSATKTITVTNLGTTSQTFQSTLDATSNPKVASSSPFAEVSSDCTLSGSMTVKLLAPGGTCHITIGFSASSSASADGFLNTEWTIGSRDVSLTGYSQAAALSVSASEIDFGTQYTNGLRLPRYLYLSNASSSSISHSPLALPSGSPFTITDGCPGTLPAASVCRIRIDYLSATSPSVDSTALALDGGLSVLITGSTLPPQTATGSTANPNLSVAPSSATFGNAVAVTGISTATSTVTIANNGVSSFPLALSITGDFTESSSCGAALAGGQTCSVVITFVPSQPGTRQGLLSVTAGSGTSPLYVSLSGSGTAILPANNGTLGSGSVAIGQPSAQFYKVSQAFSSLTVAATGPYSVILVEDLGFGPGAPDASSYAATYTGSCHNCWLGVQFQPTAVGAQPGTLTVSSAPGGSPYLLGLTGTGLPLTGLILTPATQDFGSIPVHSSSGTQLFTLTNLVPSGASVVVGSSGITGDFTVGAGGTSCGGTLAYAASCFVQASFTPTATGARTGTLSLTAGSTTATAALTGTGTTDPGIAINPLALTFANVPGPTATAETISVTNTGSAPVQVGTPTVATTSFMVANTCATLPAGATCSLTVTYLPGSSIVADAVSIPVTTTVGAVTTNVYTVALNGAYTSATAGLEITPTTVQYGPYSVGQQGPTRQFTITNLSAKPLTLNLNIPRQFALVGSPCGTLGPNASCSVSVAFTPLTNGDIPGTLYAQGIPSDGSAPLAGIGYVEGYGTGSGTLAISGGLIVGGVFSFGQVTSGQTASQTFTLSNLNPAGSPPITIRRVTSNPPFLSTTTCGSVLAVGQSCAVTVTYSPSNQVANGTESPATTSDAGSLVIESDAASGPDIVNLSGQGAAVAVANPANAAPLATFTLSQNSLSFPQTTVGNLSPAQTITLVNTGTAAIHVASAFTTSEFAVQTTCGTIVSGASCTFAVSFVPQTSGLHIASLEIASDSATSLEFVSLLASAAPAALTFSPTSLNFGSLLVGTSTTLPIQVANNGAGPITFASVTASGDYSMSGSCPPPGTVLAANSSCTAIVTFVPTASGTRGGTASFATSASTNPLTVALTGIGTQSQLLVTPSTLAFNSIVVGVSANLSVTLYNSGTAPISGLTTTAIGDYAVTIPCQQTTLVVGQSCILQVTFTPTAVGSRPGAVTVVSSDPGSPLAVPLTGTGIQGGSFAFTVNGSSLGSVTVAGGSPATYQLALTPIAGFSGAIALTCTPVNPAQFAACSLLPSSITLTGTAQNSVATINTITSAGGTAALLPPTHAIQTTFFCLLFPGLLTVWRGRHQLRRRRMLLLALLFCASCLFSLGCAGSGNFNTLYTPAGVYQYQVTASSTSGIPITQTVTLNLTVTGR